jgi:hypothetical protein
MAVARLSRLDERGVEGAAMSSSVNFGWVTANIKKLQAEMRALRRDRDMVPEAQKDLPALREFQSGLTFARYEGHRTG